MRGKMNMILKRERLWEGRKKKEALHILAHIKWK
jgi:hypothetical protein